MAEWDCLDLDCPDCPTVAQRAHARDVAGVLAALGALGLASSVRPESASGAHGPTPFADALHSGAEPVAANGLVPSTRAQSVVESCRITCRRCTAAKQLCERSSTPPRG